MTCCGARTQIIKSITSVRHEKINLAAGLERTLTTLKEMNGVCQMLENMAGNDEVKPIPGQIQLAELAAIVNCIDGFQPGSVDTHTIILETQGLRVGMVYDERPEAVSLW